MTAARFERRRVFTGYWLLSTDYRLCYDVAADFVRRRCKAVFGVKVYGADSCEDTQHAREFLDRLGVQYQYVNIEQDESAAAWVREQNGGKERKPTVNIAGQVLSVPSDHELTGALRERGLMA